MGAQKPIARDYSEVYRWSPLVEVAYEIRFHPLLKIESHIHEFQAVIREELSDISIGQAESGNRVYDFDSPARKMKVRVTAASFALMQNKHSSFPETRSQIEHFQRAFLDVFAIEKATRIGLRYINQVSLGDLAQARVRTSEYFLSDWARGPYSAAEVLSYRSDVQLQRGKNMLTVRSGVLPLPDNPSKGIFLLDIDAYRLGVSNISDSLQILDSLRNEIKPEFHAHITDAFVQRMREGRPLENSG